MDRPNPSRLKPGVAFKNLPLAKSRSRGLSKLNRRVGDITKVIRPRLRHASPVSLLEVGCGYGAALLELAILYGKQVTLVGINKMQESGYEQNMMALALQAWGLSEQDIKDFKFPEILYFDVCHPWPLPDNFFDIIYSQHAFLWFEDKVKVLEEIHRVMKANGLALLDLQVKRSAGKSSIVILKGSEEIAFWDYVRKFENLTFHLPARRSPYEWCRRMAYRLLGKKKLFVERRAYIEMTKAKEMNFNLEFCYSKRYSESETGRKGCRSYYRIKDEIDETNASSN